MPRLPEAAACFVVLALLLAGCAGPDIAGPDDGTVPPPPPDDGKRGGSPGGGGGGDGGEGNGSAPSPPAPPAAPLEELRIALEPALVGLDSPLGVLHAGDGSGRLYVVEQAGFVRLVEGAGVREELFLDLRDRVSSGGERGLLGLAFPPDFAGSGRFYAHYTDPRGDSVVARYRIAGDEPHRGDPDSEEVLLSLEQPYANHNGGQLAFGPDGMLYIGLGDGGSGGDPHRNGQDRSTLLGSVLRLDVSGEGPYEVPPDNPFVGREGRDEIWAWGLRNPWRFSFDPEQGHLYIADVGQSEVEEVNFEPAGSPGGVNYGWNVWEGTRRFRSSEPASEVVFPVAEYTHDDRHCSVTGGHVYRGEGVPALRGVYLYADYCSGVVWGLRGEGGSWVSRQLLDTGMRISSFGVDAAGEILVVDHAGALHRVVAG